MLLRFFFSLFLIVLLSNCAVKYPLKPYTKLKFENSSEIKLKSGEYVRLKNVHVEDSKVFGREPRGTNSHAYELSDVKHIRNQTSEQKGQGALLFGALGVMSILVMPKSGPSHGESAQGPAFGRLLGMVFFGGIGALVGSTVIENKYIPSLDLDVQVSNTHNKQLKSTPENGAN